MGIQIDAALLLWNPDVIYLVAMVLKGMNLRANGIEPSGDAACVQALIASRRARVVVFDLRPPYAKSTAIARTLVDAFPDRAFVFTCADSALARTAGPWLACYDVFQKPYDLLEIAGAVKSLAGKISQWRDERIVEQRSDSRVCSRNVIVF